MLATIHSQRPTQDLEKMGVVHCCRGKRSQNLGKCRFARAGAPDDREEDPAAHGQAILAILLSPVPFVAGKPEGRIRWQHQALSGRAAVKDAHQNHQGEEDQQGMAAADLDLAWDTRRSNVDLPKAGQQKSSKSEKRQVR